MGSADNTVTEISEAAHKVLMQDDHHSSIQINSIPQMLQWETCPFHIISSVSILLHIIKSDSLLSKVDVCRKLVVGDSMSSDKLSLGWIPHITWVMSKRNTIETVKFPEGISIPEFIHTLISYFSTFQADTSTSLALWTSRFCAWWILHPTIYWVNGVTVTI